MSSHTPKRYQEIKEKYPELIEAYEKMGIAAHTGPLDTKTAHLIKLAAAAAVKSEGAVHSHTRRALEAGATKPEIRHAVLLLATTIGFPQMMAALSWVDDILEE
jgi:AhpD family alkylhydroperoxidase